MWIPDTTVHGVWVRSTKLDTFGRIAYRVNDRLYDESVEFMVMWQPSKKLDPRRESAGYHKPEDLVVRPHKPKPWFKQDRIPKETNYVRNPNVRQVQGRV